MVERTIARNLVVSLMLVLSLSACGGDSTTPTPDPTPTPIAPTPKEVSGTVEGWTGGEAVVRAQSFSSETGEPTVFAEGGISTDGSFSLTLPIGDDIPDDAFSTVDEIYFCPPDQGSVNAVEISPSGSFDSALVYYFSVYDSGDSEYLGDIFPGEAFGETSYAYDYVASDVTVTGNCVLTSSDSGGSSSSTLRYDLDYKAGWNELISTYDGESVTLSTGSIPAGTSWTYLEPPVEPPPPCDPEDPECLPPPLGMPVEPFLGKR